MKYDIRAVRLRAIADFPYFARGLCLLQFVKVLNHATWSIDQHGRVYYDPELLQVWDVKEAAVVLVHELGHWLRKHCERVHAAIPEAERVQNKERINCCEDAELNDDLTGLPTKPFPGIYPKTLGCPDHLTWEEYYAWTRGRAPRPQSPQCGSGAHGVPCPWDLGPPKEGEGLPNPLVAEAVRREVAKDILRSRAAGTLVGAGWLSWAAELLGPPRIPWEQQLLGLLHRALARKAGQLDYSYQRRSRRQQPGIILPGMVRPSVRAAVVLDTSGSMNEADRTAAVRETLGIARAVAEVTLFCTDSEVRLVRRVSSVRDIQLRGGGGTDMGAGMLKAATHPADVTVVITDGATPWPAARHPRELIVVLVGEQAAPPESVPPYAKVVQCLPEQSKKNAAVAS